MARGTDMGLRSEAGRSSAGVVRGLAAGRSPRPVQPTAARVPWAVTDLLRRSDDELVAAQLAGDPGERLVHAHLAALRAAAAVLAAGGPTRRGRPRPVWDLVAELVPELSDWTAYFAAGAPLRAAVEAGRDPGVAESRADDALAAAEDFQDAVRELLGDARASAPVRAS